MLALHVEVDPPQRVDRRLALAVVARDLARAYRNAGRCVAGLGRRRDHCAHGLLLTGGRGRTTQPLRVDVVLASATWPVIASGAGRRLQFDRHELVARRDRQLREDLAQVVIDGALAEEQLPSDFPVGGTACDEACDLDLLRRQLVDRARIPLARRLAAGAQLAVRALGPWCRTDALELVQGGSQMLASLYAPARTAQVLAVEQLGAGSVEGAPVLCG